VRFFITLPEIAPVLGAFFINLPKIAPSEQ